MRAFAILFSFFITAVLAEETPSNVPPPKPAEWLTKTFRFPPLEFFLMRQSHDKTPSELKALTDLPSKLPPLDGSAALWVNSIRDCTAILQPHLESYGEKFPQGTAFLYDSMTGTLAVRTTVEKLHTIESLSVWLMKKVPQNLVFHVEIVQADASTIRQISQKSVTQSDHTTSWLHLKEQAKFVDSARLETRSGQRVRAAAGGELPLIESFIINQEGCVEIKRDMRSTGLSLEIDPVLNPDSKMIDVAYGFKYHFAPPAQQSTFAGQVGKLGNLELPTLQYYFVDLESSATFLSGATRLLGVWNPKGKAEFDHSEVMQAAFLRAEAVPLLPAENKMLAQILDRLADNEQTSSKLSPDDATSLGMELRRWKLPEGLFSSDLSRGPQDPFAETKSSEQAPPSIATPHSVLKSFGLPFPEGAWALYESSTNTLAVLNTPENLETVDDFVTSTHHHYPHVLFHTVEIIQADGPTLRRLSQQADSESDHTALWKEIEDLSKAGIVKRLQSVLTQTRSGQRSTYQSGEEISELVDLSFGGVETTELGADAEKSKKVPLSAEHFMTGKFEPRMVGTRLEIDPVLQADGETIDLNFHFEYHYAPPTKRPNVPVKDATQAATMKTFEIKVPDIDFHYASILSAISLQSGKPRLVHLWKPVGTPEFDNADILQAAFIRVNEVEITP